MTAEKAILDTLFSRPPEAYGEVWARDFRRRLAELGWLVVRDPRETVAEWMIRHGYATGHGDTVEDLLAELVAHLK